MAVWPVSRYFHGDPLCDVVRLLKVGDQDCGEQPRLLLSRTVICVYDDTLFVPVLLKEVPECSGHILGIPASHRLVPQYGQRLSPVTARAFLDERCESLIEDNESGCEHRRLVR